MRCNRRKKKKFLHIFYLDQPPLFYLLFFSGEVTIVALAPLTNLALSMRLDSTVGRKIKDLYIMGGNIEGTVYFI